MDTMNAKETLNHLYGLMMEINFYRSEEELLVELENRPNKRIEMHLAKIKQISAKLKAEAAKERFSDAIYQLKKFKEKGIEEFRKLLGPQDQLLLQPLFRKFDELTEEDKADILEDQELLRLMGILKEKLGQDE